MMRRRRPPIAATAVFRYLAMNVSGRDGIRQWWGSAQAEAAGDDAAQDLRGAALNGELGSDQGRVRELFLQAGEIGHFGLKEGGKRAHARGELLFPDGTEVRAA